MPIEIEINNNNKLFLYINAALNKFIIIIIYYSIKVSLREYHRENLQWTQLLLVSDTHHIRSVNDKVAFRIQYLADSGYQLQAESIMFEIV